MTVPAQVLAAVRSIPHPRQEPHMTAPAPSPAEQAVIERSGIFEPEEAVERVARAIASEAIAVTLVADDEWDFYLRPDEQEDYRRLAAAAIAAVPIGRAVSIRAMRDVADNLDYYASKTAGGTHASGLEDAAAQIRDTIAAID